jgi:hypothetical protein
MAIGEIIMFGDNVGVIFDGEPATPDVSVPSPIVLGMTPVSAIPAPVDSISQPVAPPPLPARYQPTPEQALPEVEPEQAVEAGKKPVNTWLLAGCGCLLVILVLAIALLAFIDQPWNSGGGLYCVSPFDIIFRSLGYCP